jgi:hypothetical protein
MGSLKWWSTRGVRVGLGTRNVLLYGALLFAYCYVGLFRLLLVLLVPFGTEPYYEQFWYGGTAAHLVPAFLACLAVGWMSGWRKSLLHGVGMGAVTVAAYALIDLVEYPGTHAEPITWKTGPFFFLALSLFYLGGTVTGSLLHVAWTKLRRKASPSTSTR